MMMNLSEATDIVKGMLHTYCLCTEVDCGDICAHRTHLLMTCKQRCSQNFESVHGTCPVVIDFFPYWVIECSTSFTSREQSLFNRNC